MFLRPLWQKEGRGNDALWKPWKAKCGLSTVATNAWKSQEQRFPHSHRPGYGYLSLIESKSQKQRPLWRPWKSGNPKSGFPLSHRPNLPAAQGENLNLRFFCLIALRLLPGEISTFPQFLAQRP
jgi:hypothetical protein